MKILLQTTIPQIEDNWHIGRFTALQRCLAELTHEGAPPASITARDRESSGKPDPTLSTLDRSDFDQLWLFGVDNGDGLTPEDCEGISRFRRRGGGLLVTRDHSDLGSSLCHLDGVGAAHYFHSRNSDPDASRHSPDDLNPSISWPNYHSGWNGDFQEISVAGAMHPVLLGAGGSGQAIRYLPAHPHEGGVGAPPDDPAARVIALGRSAITHRLFNLAVAFDPPDETGRALADSSFHHFADYNWDLAAGCPSFVDDPPGHTFAATPAAMDDTRIYVHNIARWLGRVDV